MIPIEEGLGVERVDMRGPTFHEEKDDPFRPRRKMRLAGSIGGEQRMERHLAEAEGCGPEKLTSLENRAHWRYTNWLEARRLWQKRFHW